MSSETHEKASESLSKGQTAGKIKTGQSWILNQTIVAESADLEQVDRSASSKMGQSDRKRSGWRLFRGDTFPMHLTFILISLASLGLQQGPSSEVPQDDAVQKLVDQLGSNKFRLRQTASSKLRQLGANAVPALRKAAASENAEVANRAQAILRTILGTDARERFLREPTQANAASIVDWDQVRRVFRSDADAISGFAGWLKAEPMLFEAQVVGGKELEQRIKRIVDRLADFSKKAQPAEEVLTRVNALLFIASTSKLTNQSRSEIEKLFKLATIRRAMLPQQRRVHLRKLAGMWILSEQGSQDEKLLLSLRNGLPEGLTLAESIVRQKARGSRMQYALHAIGRFGGKKQVALLKSQLTNTTRLSRPRVRAVRENDSRRTSPYQCQVRDVALGMLWHLHGEKPGNHGFDPKRATADTRFVYSLSGLGFSSEEQRKAAFAEWTKFESQSDAPKID